MKHRSAKIMRVCKEIGVRLSSPEFVKNHALQKENAFIGHIFPWGPLTIAYGYPASLTLYSELMEFMPDPIWESSLSHYFDLLLGECESYLPRHPSLFAGMTGICFALHLASQHNTKYKRHFLKAHQFLLKIIDIQLLKPLDSLVKSRDLPQTFQYNIATGINGVLSYLLSHLISIQSFHIAEQLVHHLLRITEPIQVQGCEIPGWYALSNYLSGNGTDQIYSQTILDEFYKKYEAGCFDTGMIHGISGCLAILAKAHLRGFQIKGIPPAIYRIMNWLKKVQQTVSGIPGVWPKRFAFHPHRTHFTEIMAEEYFDAWAYGAPGILNSMMLAACSLDDSSFIQYCVQEMEKASERIYIGQTLIQCPSFLYGLSGNLAIMHQMQMITNRDAFSKVTAKLTDQILNQFDIHSPFGFKCLPPSGNVNDTKMIHNPGITTGVSGVLLSLLFTLSSKQRPWTQLFLLN